MSKKGHGKAMMTKSHQNFSENFFSLMYERHHLLNPTLTTAEDHGT